MTHNDSVQQHFDLVADSYEVDSLHFPWTLLRRAEVQAVSALAGRTHSLNMLELGCGAGLYSRHFLKLGVQHIHAVDSSALMVEHLAEEEQIISVVSHIEDLSLEMKFDLIVAAGLLEFLEQPDMLFHVAQKHAQKDSTFLLLVPKSGFLAQLYKLYHLLHGFKINIFSQREIETMAMKHGWHLAATQKATPISTAVSFNFYE